MRPVQDADHFYVAVFSRGDASPAAGTGGIQITNGGWLYAVDDGVVFRGDLRGAEDVPVRLHSECLTGDVMGSLRCDCRDQLEAALARIAHLDRGAVVYLRQEGRGIGLANKIRAYALQDAGLDTVEANHALGFDDDLRRYDIAAAILRELGIKSVILLTNNPKKITGLAAHGIVVNGTEAVHTQVNPHNERYLATKRAKSGHLL